MFCVQGRFTKLARSGACANRKRSAINEAIEPLRQRRWMLRASNTLVDFFAMN